MVSSHPVERELFHGTSQNDADTICTDGFNRSFAGKNATLYGKGSYFAVNSSYSMDYASSCMFLASVITGDYCQGRHSMIVPDVKPGRDGNNRRYDSAVNSTTNPTIFVSFSDPNVYPSYLLTLR
uniref:poly [ADP-ribose] polymerase 12-like n=1 Tax=Ciona intestinalis TaxID=7719 RepID=UPI0005217C40|nr:poly [ADP-ribose] polymerase 12-like [Ciona intestinalis]|eukprot:XP_026693901.1 poly [ADP-ribose] polymerase 12-like [Ciona intestinalis]